MPADYLDRILDWPTYLADRLSEEEEARQGYFTETGFPMGAEAWLSGLETKSGRRLRPCPCFLRSVLFRVGEW
ncbi:hypothetical protein [Maricaulis maris]|uniref:Uncharacterized protein n=1 Tax=Maricaulis maris TaxID=74318 RepID=A0A495DLP2_9PROT|nr:hypothetical protein [Maricaulis maris]RKR03237.1 hypothetical protein C7435_1192 [Maricaulis maris]